MGVGHKHEGYQVFSLYYGGICSFVEVVKALYGT